MLTAERRREIRHRVQAEFRQPIFNRNDTLSSIIDPEYDVDDFTPDLRCVDKDDPPVIPFHRPTASQVAKTLITDRQPNPTRRPNGTWKRDTRPKAVWCVELKRHFRTMSEAAVFANRNTANIYQAIKRGVGCGGYHWELFDPVKHRDPHAANVAGR